MQAKKSGFWQKLFKKNQTKRNNRKVVFRIGYPLQKLDYDNKLYVYIEMEEDGEIRRFKLWQKDIFEFRININEIASESQRGG